MLRLTMGGALTRRRACIVLYVSVLDGVVQGSSVVAGVRVLLLIDVLHTCTSHVYAHLAA